MIAFLFGELFCSLLCLEQQLCTQLNAAHPGLYSIHSAMATEVHHQAWLACLSVLEGSPCPRTSTFLIGLSLMIRSLVTSRAPRREAFFSCRVQGQLEQSLSFIHRNTEETIWGRSPAGPQWERRPNLPKFPGLMALGNSS